MNFLIIISLCCAVLAGRNEYWLHACFSNWITGEQAEPLKFPACSPASLAANWIEAERKAVCLGIMDNRDLSQSCYNDLLKDRRKRERESCSLSAPAACFACLLSFFFLPFYVFLFGTCLLSLSSSLSFFPSLLFSLSLPPSLSSSWSCLIKNRKKKSKKNISLEQMLQEKKHHSPVLK